MTPAEEQAARFTGALWKAICFAGGLHLEQHRHFPGAYDPAWLATLTLPAGDNRPGSQPVALLDHQHRDIERHLDSQTLRDAYAHRPRTQVYEDIGHDSGDWYGLTTAHLTRLSGSALPVTCAIFASRHGDETFGAHQDAWYGAIVQIDGTKTWQIGEYLLDEPPGQPAPDLTTRAGDILLLPKYLPHAVTTPAQPGHSLHLAFALNRDQPAWGSPASPRQSQGSLQEIDRRRHHLTGTGPGPPCWPRQQWPAVTPGTARAGSHWQDGSSSGPAGGGRERPGPCGPSCGFA